MKKIILVSAGALIDRDGKVLLASRPEGQDYAGCWEFPGGKVEAGEMPEAALVRELREEVCVATEESCLAPFTFGTDERDDVGLLMTLFVCRKWTGTPAPMEGQQLRWASPRDLLNYEMPPIDRPMAAQLRDYLVGV